MRNQDQPSIDSVPVARRVSALSVWALALSVFSFFLMCLGPFAAMAAVVCGHLALSRIKVSAGSLAGRGLARAGLAVGYLSVFVYLVMVPLFVAPALDRSRERIREQMCTDNVRQIAAACLKYSESNDGYPPENLDQLRPILGVSSNGLPLVFLCPASRDHSAPSYEIETARALAAFGKPAHLVLVREKEAHHHGRRVVAYADGTLELVNGP
jgi:hypothetical protein